MENNYKVFRTKTQSPPYKYHLYFCSTEITTEYILVTCLLRTFLSLPVFVPLSVAVFVHQ